MQSIKLVFAAAFVLPLLAASNTHAQEIGTPGNLSIAAERLFGFYIDHQNEDLGPVDRETDISDFSLIWNVPTTPLTTPRLAFDYFIDENFTFGGSFGFFTTSIEQSTGGPGSANTDISGILFAVRAGYALRLGHSVSFWPRGGISYNSINVDGPGDSHLLALELEGMFTLAPAESWAFLVGPVAAIGLTGEDGGNDYSENCFGVMLGVIGWFGL